MCAHMGDGRYTSGMNLINATLLLMHFLIMSRPNISYVRFLRMSIYFMILLSVLVFYFHFFVNMCACHVYF